MNYSQIYQENSEIPEYHLQELFKQIDKSKENYKTIEDGFIMIELQDSNKNILIKTEEMKGNFYFKKIIWKDIIKIDFNLEYIFKINLKNACLYSIKFD